MSRFLGKGNRGERVKLPRKRIYAKGWIRTGIRAWAKDLNYKFQTWLLSKGSLFSLMEPGLAAGQGHFIFTDRVNETWTTEEPNSTQRGNCLLKKGLKRDLGRMAKRNPYHLMFLQSAPPVFATWVS